MPKASLMDLRVKKTKDLAANVNELKTELMNLKVAKVSNGAASKLAKISVVRKQIARVLTVISQKTRAEMRAQVKTAKKAPKQLREKKTRAIRRRLTPEQSSKLTAKAAQKKAAFPPRKFTLRA